MNIALRISEKAKLLPEKRSVVFSKKSGAGYSYPFYTFTEFEERSNQLAHRLVRFGVRPGMRTLLFVKPCLDFSVITFALFKVGAVPILIDPGMGVKNLLKAVADVEPEALVSMAQVHWLRRVLSAPFKTIKVKVSLDPVGGRTHWLYEDLNTESKVFPPLAVTPETMAAILFTSGGTGRPKGVIYTHGIFNFQTEALQRMFALSEENIDLPAFPLFALFTLAMGMTSVIPDLDPTKPAQCDPKAIVQNILDQKVSFVAGSPAIWERVGRYCQENKIELPSVKQVVMFGAPVRLEIHELFRSVLTHGDTYTPYGATEALPLTLISGSEVLSQHAAKMRGGMGTCIGKPISGVEIKIINTTDIPENTIHALDLNQIGEILVSGPQITPEYFRKPEDTKKAKIFEGGKLWHRMGDLGYLDVEGKLWFLGRKVHRVRVSAEKTFYPLRVEAIFNQHPLVKRSALVSLNHEGQIIPAIVIERVDGTMALGDKLVSELSSLAQSSEFTHEIKRFFVHPHFPVDVRHNIKIDRTQLSKWASKKI